MNPISNAPGGESPREKRGLARFDVMQGGRIMATFYSRDEQTLFDWLRDQLPNLRRDQALVAVDANALEMLLLLSTGGSK